MSKGLNWWWVVATHERGNISTDERDALRMVEFLNWHMAARVFTSKWMAQVQVKEMERRNQIPVGIKLHILNDEAWELVKYSYFKGKNYGATLLS